MRKGFLIYEEMQNISPCMRRPLVIYATAPLWISFYMRNILCYFLSVQLPQSLSCLTTVEIQRQPEKMPPQCQPKLFRLFGRFTHLNDMNRDSILVWQRWALCNNVGSFTNLWITEWFGLESQVHYRPPATRLRQNSYEMAATFTTFTVAQDGHFDKTMAIKD